MKKKEVIELLEQFKTGLLAVATDGGFDVNEYKEIRSKILEITYLKEQLPSFIRNNRTPIEFRRFMQSLYDHYAERRKFITDEINILIGAIEEYKDEEILYNIGSYELGKRLGNGGYGEVYLYYHKVLDYNFAVKFFCPVFVSQEDQIESEKRFFREAKILFELHDENIVQIYDAGYIDGKPFIRMEYIDGHNINELVNKNSIFSFDKSINAITEILKGLEYAHGKGVIHRDLKPSNIMYSEEKGFKIIDFGISAFLDAKKHTKLTKTGEQISGGLYIDPQLQINPSLRDPRSDIYSVGAIWYYLLSGKAPSGNDLKKQLLLASAIKEDQAGIVMKCLEYNLDNRFDSCKELIAILENPKVQI